jgi:hypothetical protein
MSGARPKKRPQSELEIPKGSIYHLEFWKIGGEQVTVVAQRAGITEAELSAMKSAMESAAASSR